MDSDCYFIAYSLLSPKSGEGCFLENATHSVLNCFADGDPKFWNTTEQYTWALQELRSVNRSRTPFHFVVTHCPWYNR